MTLLEEAKSVAAEFNYSTEDVRKGIGAFISQMGVLVLVMIHMIQFAKMFQTRDCRRQEPP